MKKGFFGYNVSEADTLLNALREENESLNATITTLKTQIKNNETSSAKANLLEVDLKSSEENLKQLNDEKNDLKTYIEQLSDEKNQLIAQNAVLTTKSEELSRQNDELIVKIEHIHNQNENMNVQLLTFQKRIEELTTENGRMDLSKVEELQSQLNSEKEYKTALAQANKEKAEEIMAMKTDLEEIRDAYGLIVADLDKEKKEKDQLSTVLRDYENVKAELKSAKNELEIVTGELEKTQGEISQLQDDLAIAKTAIDEQTTLKAIEKKQQANLNQASVISFRAYYEMSKMRNEVVEYLREQRQEYYQLVNENSQKMRTAFEQRQTEYNQMMREFFTKVSDFRVSLSNIEDKYGDAADYSLNIDKISNNMDEIMGNFIKESNAYLKKFEDEANIYEEYSEERVSFDSEEETAVKPLVFKISGQ